MQIKKSNTITVQRQTLEEILHLTQKARKDIAKDLPETAKREVDEISVKIRNMLREKKQ